MGVKTIQGNGGSTLKASIIQTNTGRYNIILLKEIHDVQGVTNNTEHITINEVTIADINKLADLFLTTVEDHNE